MNTFWRDSFNWPNPISWPRAPSLHCMISLKPLKWGILSHQGFLLTRLPLIVWQIAWNHFTCTHVEMTRQWSERRTGSIGGKQGQHCSLILMRFIHLDNICYRLCFRTKPGSLNTWCMINNWPLIESNSHFSVCPSKFVSMPWRARSCLLIPSPSPARTYLLLTSP